MPASAAARSASEPGENTGMAPTGLTVPDTLLLLLALFGSEEAEEMVAVLLNGPIEFGPAYTTIENEAFAPLLNVFVTQVIVPVAPAAGVVQVNGDPDV